MKRGSYIVFEGGDGSGKSYHALLFDDFLKNQGHETLTIREPGSTKIAEKIREVILEPDNTMTALTEFYLFTAARAELFQKTIIPTLEKGISVISDRNYFSSMAYQGYGRGIDPELIKRTSLEAISNTNPDLAFIIDVPTEKGLAKEEVQNRMSLESIEFHKKVRKGYQEIAKQFSFAHLVPYQDGDPEIMQSKMREIFYHILYNP